MSLKEQMETGKVYIEFGHASKEDQEYEKTTLPEDIKVNTDTKSAEAAAPIL